jgi:hypothetical protein
MGDWNGDGVDTTGYFDPLLTRWHLRDTNESGGDIYNYNYGLVGDILVVGDWDGNGTDTPGVFRSGEWRLRNSHTDGTPDVPAFTFGTGADKPVVGDWNGDAIDTVGYVKDIGGGANWYLTDSHSNNIDYGPIAFGSNFADDIPVTGDWDGDGDDSIGQYKLFSGFWRFRLSDALTAPQVDQMGAGCVRTASRSWLHAETTRSIRQVLQRPATRRWTAMETGSPSRTSCLSEPIRSTAAVSILPAHRSTASRSPLTYSAKRPVPTG